MTTQPQREHILTMIEAGRADGAQCVLGGGRPSDPAFGEGWFVEPTIFTGVRNDMRVAQDEVFGPVLSIIPFDDDDEAIRIANDSALRTRLRRSGPGTSDARSQVSQAMEAGTVWVNTYRAVSFMAPFGGYKRSGIGRESGQESIYEYLQTKTVWFETEESTTNPFVIR